LVSVNSLDPLFLACHPELVEGSLETFFCDDAELRRGIRDHSTPLRMTKKER